MNDLNSARKIGVILAITLTVIFGGFCLITADSPKQQKGETTTVQTSTEVQGSTGKRATTLIIPIKVGEWSGMTTDPEKESADMNIMEPDLRWLIVLNKDFQHPIPMSTNGDEIVKLGDSVKEFHFSLPSGQGVNNARIIFKKIPK